MTDKAEMLTDEELATTRIAIAQMPDGHDMAANANTVARLIATIDHIRAQLASVVADNAELFKLVEWIAPTLQEGFTKHDDRAVLYIAVAEMRSNPHQGKRLLSEVEGLRAQVATLTEDVKRAQLVQDAWSIEAIEGLKKRAEKAESEFARRKQDDNFDGDGAA